jgi:chromosome segregation ATPase
MTKARRTRCAKTQAKKTQAKKTQAKKTQAKPNGKKSLTSKEQETLIQLDKSLAQQKVQLANIELQIDELRQQKKRLIRELRRGRGVFTDAAKDMAEAHGIDTESETESWRLDLSTMAFVRAGQQGS